MIQEPHLDFRAGGFELKKPNREPSTVISVIAKSNNDVIGKPPKSPRSTKRASLVTHDDDTRTMQSIRATMSSVVSEVTTFGSEVDTVAEYNRPSKINEHISELDEDMSELPPLPASPQLSMYSDHGTTLSHGSSVRNSDNKVKKKKFKKKAPVAGKSFKAAKQANNVARK